jgi:hypothetical protein
MTPNRQQDSSAWTRIPQVAGIRQGTDRDVGLDADVRGRSWQWLVELGRRIGIDLQLVDTRGTLVSPAPAMKTSALATLLEAAPAPVMAAIREAISLRQPQFVSVKSRQIVCVPLTVNGIVRGASVTARVAGATGTEPGDQAFRGQLEAVGTRLAHAIEAHLEAPRESANADCDRIVTFAQVLAEAHQSGSERELLGAFVQALSMWHDIDSCVYLETGPGLFAMDVSLPGTAWDLGPSMSSLAACADGVLTSLTPGETEQCGLPTDRDVVVTRLPRPDGSRIVVMRGHLPQREISRISAYLSLLEERLRYAEADRALTALKHIAVHCRADDLTASDVARRVLRETVGATGTLTASLDVDDDDGTPLLRVRVGEAPGNTDDGSGGFRVSRTAGGHRLTLTVASRSDRVSPAMETFIETVADLLVGWQRSSGRSGEFERRRSPEPGDEPFERLARQALECGDDITAVVVRAGERADIASARQWVGNWRAYVRPADSVALLRPGEIGILLRGGSSTAAQAVVDRLMRASHLDPLQHRVSVGVASHSSGARLPERVLPLPRANADSANARPRRQSEAPQHDE